MTLTPMMQQYQDAKDKHPGMILLFRMGDFYELFGADAEEASKILGIKITSRDKAMPMAGFPHQALEEYLRKLLKAGQRVAICDQVEDAAQAKGLVKREVTRVVTAGTLTEDELLDPRQANHLVAVTPPQARSNDKLTGVAWVDLSTGKFMAADFPLAQLPDELARLNPSECLHPEERFLAATPLDDNEGITLSTLTPLARTWSPRPDWTFDPTSSRAVLMEHFGVRTFQGFGFVDEQPCLIAAGALVQYLQETLKSSLTHLRKLEPHLPGQILRLDEVTRRSLELSRTLRDNEREGSLLSVIDRTVTPMGARLLHDWLMAPLADRNAIEARLDAVGEFVAEPALRRDLREGLKDAYDLQRLTARVSTGRASPRDLAAVAHTLRLLPRIKAKITSRKAALLRELEGQLELCPDLREALETALVDEPPLAFKDGGIIRPGFSAELDDLRDTARGGKEWIARFQADEITRTGINSLKVGFNKVFGYYIEITNTHAQKAPADYERKQTLKNAERYITPELKAYEEKVLSAEEKSQNLEYELFSKLREQVAAQTHRILQTAEMLAHIDVLAGLAELAEARRYCRPELIDTPVLEIRDGRHPVLDQTLPPGTFVPNDVVLTPEQGSFWLITGPNMAGKSTFIRQVATLTILAQMGSYVPARLARIGITDRVFTRVGAADELSRGRSTFMVEMTEAANILNNATAGSLVILDEIGRGTSTYDGVSLAWSITEYLHSKIGCRTLFATHYHEIAQLTESLPRLCNYNVLVREYEDEIVFLHKIAPGSADKSYGIHVARLAGVPDEVLDRAEEVLAELESQHRLKVEGKERRREPRKRKRIVQQPSLFEEFQAPPEGFS